MASDVRPHPLIVEAFGWAGNDGNWSTFRISIGNPPQDFQVLPSTCANEIWVPTPDGCTVPVSDCPASRGVLSTGTYGFQPNESTTWHQQGVENLGSEDHYFNGSDNGLYGLDTFSFDENQSVTVPNQVIAAIGTSNFWLGSLGLGDVPSYFPVVSHHLDPSLISSLKARNVTPSLSYGFYAGSSYRSSPSSLVIGGYDSAAFSSDHVQSYIIAASRRSLPIWLRSLVISNTLNGTISSPVASDGLRMAIDSTVSQLWLPRSICDDLASSLGLKFADNTGLYYINDTTHNQLVQLNPEFTFTLSNEALNETTNIVLPYAAFDLMIGPPTYTGELRYFPIRRSTNELQNTLGRAFLQEAYMVVDWERKTFRVGQASHQSQDSRNIVEIEAVTGSRASSGSLSAGAIAGIAVGLSLGLVIVLSLIYFFWRKRGRRQQLKANADGVVPPRQEDEKELESNEQRWSGLQEDSIKKTTPELHGEERLSQLASTPVHELLGDTSRAELEGHDTGRLVRRDLFGNVVPFKET